MAVSLIFILIRLFGSRGNSTFPIARHEATLCSEFLVSPFLVSRMPPP
jgi:hypothetical protein